MCWTPPRRARGQQPHLPEQSRRSSNSCGPITKRSARPMPGSQKPRPSGTQARATPPRLPTTTCRSLRSPAFACWRISHRRDPPRSSTGPPFFHTWELRGRYPFFSHEKYGVEATKTLRVRLQALLDELIAGRRIRARGVYGFFPRQPRGRGRGSVCRWLPFVRAHEVPFPAPADGEARQLPELVAGGLHRAEARSGHPGALR